jgi:hypothetical protein
LFLDAAPDRNANLAFGIDGSFAANIRIADDNLDQLQLYTGSDITNGISIAQTGSVSVGSTDIEDAALYVYEDSESDSIKIESDSDSSPNLKFARNGSDFANIRVSDQGEDRFEIQVGTNLEHGIGILQNGKVVVGDAPATAKFNVSLTNGTTIGPPTTADLANAALLVRESGLSLAFDPNQIVSDATAINLQNINPAGVIRLHAGRSDDPHVIVESDGDVVIAQDLNVSQSIEANTINADVITVQNNAVITTAEFDPSNFVAADGGSSISAVSLTSTSGNVNGGSSGLILNAGGAGDQDVSINPTGGGSAKIYGDVTIGTESENQDLYVEGTVRAREIIVDQESWADHVFSSDYQLASLDQVEQHIDRNGHLPGIPSEAEVKQEGVSVGQMQMLLLQKVEELTLHIIAQEKRIESLEQELETARNK